MVSAYLLDSNHAGTLVTLTHETRRRIIARMAAGDEYKVTLPTITETVFGFSTLPRAQQNARAWQFVRPALVPVNMDEADALNAATMQVTLRRQGWQLQTIDALIATLALRYNLVLLTTDRDFQPIAGLTIENWT